MKQWADTGWYGHDAAYCKLLKQCCYIVCQLARANVLLMQHAYPCGCHSKSQWLLILTMVFDWW